MKHSIGQCRSEVYCLIIWHRQLSFLLPTRRSRPLHACWRVSHTDTKANIHISSHPSIPRFPSDVRICCYTMLNSIQQLLFCYHIVCFLCYVIISKSMYPFFSSTFNMLWNSVSWITPWRCVIWEVYLSWQLWNKQFLIPITAISLARHTKLITLLELSG